MLYLEIAHVGSSDRNDDSGATAYKLNSTSAILGIILYGTFGMHAILAQQKEMFEAR